MSVSTLGPADITGLVLAGGRASRMGGIDKGLQDFDGVPLALHALRRLRPQVGTMLLNANRNLSAYEDFGAPVWPDTVPGFAGPLAGILAGLDHCDTPCLLIVPCDAPLFPADLARRLADAMADSGAEIATASAPQRLDDGSAALRAQPVFSLLHAALHHSLRDFLQAGGRKVGAWTAQHRTVLVPFDRPGDDPEAFANANTLAELQALAPSRHRPPA